MKFLIENKGYQLGNGTCATTSPSSVDVSLEGASYTPRGDERLEPFKLSGPLSGPSDSIVYPCSATIRLL